MHIAEGVLNAPTLITGAVVAVGGIAIGLRTLKNENLMFAGLLGAVFFVAGLIHIPVGPSSAHLILNGLLGILLGAAAFPVIFIALLLQVILFQFGGFTVLGINTATMGIGALCAYGTYRFLNRRFPAKISLDAFTAGFISVFCSSLLTACALAFSHEGFLAAAGALFASNLPVMIVEGFITLFLIDFIKRTKPDLLPGN